jgi:hypothetical protein
MVKTALPGLRTQQNQPLAGQSFSMGGSSSKLHEQLSAQNLFSIGLHAGESRGQAAGGLSHVLVRPPA